MEVFYFLTSSKVAEKIIEVSIIEEMKHKIFDVLAQHELELRLSVFWHLGRDHVLKFVHIIYKFNPFSNFEHAVERDVDVDLRVLVDLQVRHDVVFNRLVVDEELLFANLIFLGNTDVRLFVLTIVDKSQKLFDLALAIVAFRDAFRRSADEPVRARALVVRSVLLDGADRVLAAARSISLTRA